jgi:hypothetical protein
MAAFDRQCHSKYLQNSGLEQTFFKNSLTGLPMAVVVDRLQPQGQSDRNHAFLPVVHDPALPTHWSVHQCNAGDIGGGREISYIAHQYQKNIARIHRRVDCVLVGFAAVKSVWKQPAMAWCISMEDRTKNEV